MVNKDKLLKLCIPLETKQEGDEKELIISGHASTNDEDRSGDVIVTDAWRKPAALKNYLKNPIVLAFHDMSRPIGKTIGHEVDDKGLKITAKISKAAGNIRDLIKEGIVSAFSVGFMIKDADFNSENGVFVIKDVELYEVSVVSIPANQNALFSIEKNFSDPEEYEEFKKQFIKESEETLMVDKAKEDKVETQPIDIASLAKEISGMVKSDLAAEQKAAEEAKKAKEEEEVRIAATATTAAERMIKDLREELVEKEGTLAEALEGMRDLLKKQQEEGELQKAFTAENKGKMQFEDANTNKFSQIDQNTRFGMLYASKLLNKPLHELDTWKELVTKSNMEHWDSSTVGSEWEEEYSTTVQNAMRQQLVIEPLFTTIPMSTPSMTMPINPEAGDATWVNESAYRSSVSPEDETTSGASSGDTVNHQLLEQTITARKLATREYIGYEEEEDSIVTLAPIISDAVSRRMARSTDLALLRGTGDLTSGAGYDPITGLEGRGANTTPVEVAGGASWAVDSTWSEDLVVDMRRNLGIYGLDPSALVLVASHDLYYELMKLPNFKTVDVLGPQATILTGQVGSLFGVRVLVSQNFDNTAITDGDIGTTLGIMVRPSNFIVGNLRGIMTETDRDIINQKRVIVSSRRFAFNDIISGEGTVNLQIAT
jgi:HK97 family phage prohead protease/HK97 family phage major capsid protein